MQLTRIFYRTSHSFVETTKTFKSIDPDGSFLEEIHQGGVSHRSTNLVTIHGNTARLCTTFAAKERQVNDTFQQHTASFYRNFADKRIFRKTIDVMRWPEKRVDVSSIEIQWSIFLRRVFSSSRQLDCI